MGLFGSLFTGVSALFSQSQNTAIISNNIANISTTGFKRSEAAFQSLVTTQSRLSAYSPGTVTVNRIQRVDQQGALQQTTSATDAAISGNGFFAVKRSTDSSQEFLYTRAGQFSEDAQGLLRNAAGFVLYAWPLDANGNLPANQGDLTSLVPADVAFLGGLTRPTSNAEISLNLNADEVDKTLQDSLTSAPNFSRGITVYDSLGSAQVLTLEYTKTYGPQATAGGTVGDMLATNNLITDTGLTNGNQFSVSSELGGPLTLTVVNTTPAAPGEVQTVNDIITEINNSGLGVSAFLGNNGELVIQRNDFTGGAANTLTLENVTGAPLTGLGITLTANPETFVSDDLTGGQYANGSPTDTPPYSTGDGAGNVYPSLQFLPGDAQYNNRGWWQLKVIHPNGTTLTNGLMNFNGDGTLNSIPDGSGNIDLNLSQIDWNNGSNPQNIDINIESFSQFAGNYDVIFADQNGAELGLRTGVEITRDGMIVARFSNGATANLYKAPLITFANPNGLQEVSGTAYTKNQASGEENLREAGRGGAGFIEPSSLQRGSGQRVCPADRIATCLRRRDPYDQHG
jgi:flagellar hook-basal body protein